MASTPTSLYSSPSRRGTSASTTTSSSSNSSSSRYHGKPKICRRWSMDNINSKEGYVKDLRKQHQSHQVGIKDEAYPFMMSESNRRRGRIGSLDSHNEAAGRSGRTTRPSSTSPPGGHFSQVKRTRTMSLDEDPVPEDVSATTTTAAMMTSSRRSKRLGSDSAIHGRFHNRGSRKSPYGSNSSLSLDLSTSIVPEDLELPSEVVEVKAPEKEANLVLNSSSIISIGNMPFLRKRSSSLPRILPPILDRDNLDDDEEAQDLYDGMHVASGGGHLAAYKQMDQTSNLIVREMQKFVCRFAAEVSQVLPLPLPANSRQQRIGGCKMVASKKKLDWKHTQVLVKNLAKLHVIGYAIRKKSPGLFQEIASSLEAIGGHQRPLDVLDRDRSALVKILETYTPLLAEGCYDEIISNVRSQASELYDSHTCPLFPVIVHGHVKNLMFRYQPDSAEVIGVKLPSLRFACIGSPLVDIYAAIFYASGHLNDTASRRGHLQTYRASFLEVAQHLRVQEVMTDFSLEKLEAAFKKYELTGMILSHLRKSVELSRSCSLGGRDMAFRGHEAINPKAGISGIHDLGSDLSKLALDIPFCHEEDPAELNEDISLPKTTNSSSMIAE